MTYMLVRNRVADFAKWKPTHQRSEAVACPEVC